MNRLALAKVNWRLALSALWSDAFIILGIVAALPYSLGEMGITIDPEWKGPITKYSLIAAGLTKIISFYLRLFQLPVPSLPPDMQPTPTQPSAPPQAPPAAPAPPVQPKV